MTVLVCFAVGRGAGDAADIALGQGLGQCASLLASFFAVLGLHSKQQLEPCLPHGCRSLQHEYECEQPCLCPLPYLQAGSEAQQQPNENGGAHNGQAGPGAKAARRSVDGAEASPGRTVAAAAAAKAKDPSWTEQRYAEPDLDYGDG